MTEISPGEQPEKHIPLDGPELYPDWFVAVLKEGAATGRVPEMKHMLRGLVQYAESGVLTELGVSEQYEAIVETIREEIKARTAETVAELNQAMEVYGEELPKTFVQTEAGGGWKLVEGFAQGADFTINPVVEGDAWIGNVYGIRQDSAENE